MADDQPLTKEQIKQMITDEVRKAVKTQLADSTDGPNPVSNQFLRRFKLTIDDFELRGMLKGSDKASNELMTKLQKLGKPKNPTKKTSSTTKKS